MSFLYTVQSGDTLTLIAKRHGLSSWRDIYFAPENAAFRQKRPNPDRIFPGDVVTIPGGGAPPSDGPTRLCARDELPNLNPFMIPDGAMRFR